MPFLALTRSPPHPLHCPHHTHPRTWLLSCLKLVSCSPHTMCASSCSSVSRMRSYRRKPAGQRAAGQQLSSACREAAACALAVAATAAAMVHRCSQPRHHAGAQLQLPLTAHHHYKPQPSRPAHLYSPHSSTQPAPPSPTREAQNSPTQPAQPYQHPPLRSSVRSRRLTSCPRLMLTPRMQTGLTPTVPSGGISLQAGAGTS